MPRGFIDAITSAGWVEGWAYDEHKPLEPLLVAVVNDNDEQVATGLANLYRKDLADANHGFGWCHFRLCVNRNVDELRRSLLKLVALDPAATICAVEHATYSEVGERVIDNVPELIRNDPTVIGSLDEIESLEEIFENFIRARGVDPFVRAAYVYVLGRSIDESGLLLYSRLIRQRRMSPFAMLRTLADSPEFGSKPRRLVAPNQPGFPFRQAKR
jgi:hypothetical protein